MHSWGDRKQTGSSGAPRGVAAAGSARAGDAPPSHDDLASLSLEEPTNFEVTLATRAVQKLFDSTVAAYVGTAEDIRRSGASSIPEALRMVPGLDVARTGSSKWAITAPGFTDEFANELLVLVDGGTVYTRPFAGVHWDTPDVLLEDVERIEVIRGPGASRWGANAVNGVINIVTRDAAETVGGLVSAQGGSPDRRLAGARYGGAVGSGGHYRFRVKHTDRASLSDRSGEDAADDWRTLRGGGRVEWRQNADAFTLDGGDGELDAALYFATGLPNRGVPSWSRLDLMLGWRPNPSFDLRVGAQNVLEKGQQEFDRNIGGHPATEIPRSRLRSAGMALLRTSSDHLED